MNLHERFIRRLRYWEFGTICALCSSSPLGVQYSRTDRVKGCDAFTRTATSKTCYVFVEEGGPK